MIINTDTGKITMQKGEIVTMPVPDPRRWPRFKAWVQRKPPPVIYADFIITAAEFHGAETFDSHLALWFKRTVEAGEMPDEDVLGFKVKFADEAPHFL